MMHDPTRAAALRAMGLHKRFGGIAAVDGAELHVAAGQLHALIGPNGAGKSTLVHLLAGALAPDAGSISLDGVGVTGLSMHARVRLGLARSYQVTNVFRALTSVENVALALQARQGRVFNPWQARPDAELRAQAQSLLAQCDLIATALPAQQLAHGDQRKLEVALALAVGTRVLLLDEPLAGMSETEASAMIEVIARLKGRVTLLLVEHDMDAVFRLADRISVLVSGKVIATGTPQEIQTHAEVRRAYLGDELAHGA